MLLTVVSSLIFTQNRKAMQIFPESVREIWNEWELRAMVLISLALQAILILIGNWRKHSTSNILRIVLWLAYLSADSVATVSLGILSSNQEDSEDWTRLWLSKHKNTAVDLLHRAASSIPWIKDKRWSNTLAQYNLITFCLKERPAKCIFINEDLFINRLLEKYRYTDLKDVSKELKKLIFRQLRDKSETASNFEASRLKELCAQRGNRVLEKAKCLDDLGWTINGAEFDQSIILWHIATDLCYYSDLNRNRDLDQSLNFEASRVLSNYMLYLLVMCPFMLPNGIGQIRFRDTCAEAKEFIAERKSITDAKKACTMLLKVSTDILPSKVKGDRSKSVLFDACRLAKALQSLESKGPLENNEKKWEFISHVWVEMLAFAANQCRWSDHAQQLRRGGELLTHIWLLMAHLGLTEQFQISEGHVRAKLIVE